MRETSRVRRPMLSDRCFGEPQCWIFKSRIRRKLPSPGRGADHAAEVAAPEGRIFVRENIGFHVAEGCLGLVLDAVIEVLDDVFLEMRSTRMCMHHRLSLCVGEFGIVYSQYVHFDAGR